MRREEDIERDKKKEGRKVRKDREKIGGTWEENGKEKVS